MSGDDHIASVILEAVNEQGKAIAAIDERTKGTNAVVKSLSDKVDSMRGGDWNCPQGIALRTEMNAEKHRVDKLEEADDSQWSAIRGVKERQASSYTETPPTPVKSPMSVKRLGTLIAAALIGLGLAAMFFINLFGG